MFARSSKLILVSLVALAIAGCSTAEPNAGYEGVLIEKPYIFGHGGIDPTPVTTGMSIIAMSTSVEYVSMQPIQAELVASDMMTSDGVPLNFDAIIRLQVTNSVGMIRDFGPDWYKQNVEKEFYNLIRQQVKQHGLNETAIQPTAIETIDSKVSEGLVKYLNDIHMPAKLIAVTVGKALPPDAIKTQRIATAEQQQRIQTEGQRKLAEDARKAAEQSRADADNAFRNAMQMSPDQYLQLEKIHMQKEVCMSGAKCTFIENGGRVPLMLDGK